MYSEAVPPPSVDTVAGGLVHSILHKKEEREALRGEQDKATSNLLVHLSGSIPKSNPQAQPRKPLGQNGVEVGQCPQAINK